MHVGLHARANGSHLSTKNIRKTVTECYQNKLILRIFHIGRRFNFDNQFWQPISRKPWRNYCIKICILHDKLLIVKVTKRLVQFWQERFTFWLTFLNTICVFQFQLLSVKDLPVKYGTRKWIRNSGLWALVEVNTYSQNLQQTGRFCWHTLKLFGSNAISPGNLEICVRLQRRMLWIVNVLTTGAHQ